MCFLLLTNFNDIESEVWVDLAREKLNSRCVNKQNIKKE